MPAKRKISDKAARKMLIRYYTYKYSIRELAKKFNINRSSAERIIKGTLYKHLNQ